MIFFYSNRTTIVEFKHIFGNIIVLIVIIKINGVVC